MDTDTDMDTDKDRAREPGEGQGQRPGQRMGQVKETVICKCDTIHVQDCICTNSFRYIHFIS
jgi:hypothetical protein